VKALLNFSMMTSRVGMALGIAAAAQGRQCIPRANFPGMPGVVADRTLRDLSRLEPVVRPFA
jgi:hypothetical protein